LRNYDLVILNFANPDMVGHTASSSRDQVGRGDRRLRPPGCGEDAGVGWFTAHHRRSRELRADAEHRRLTKHRTHDKSRALLYVAENASQATLESGILADVAPTLLALLGIAQPAEMTGRNLLSFQM
jgi:2,3-bisphosphoglycerate-independent phosphoglycerate mutase